MEAAQSGNEKTVLLLLAHGTDIHASNNSGGSILQEMATAEIVQILLENGAVVDDASLKDKITGLDRAIRGGQEEVVKLLLEKGQNPIPRTAQA